MEVEEARPWRISAVLLAAGESRRLKGGTPKQLLPVQGVPMVRRIASQALESSLDEVIVVLGFAAEEVGQALEGLPLQLVYNPHYADGQSTSVKTGLRALSGASRAALFLTADQPWLETPVLEMLLDTYRRTGSRIVLPVWQGRRGSPVLFDRSLFPCLERLQGDEGGRQILSEHPEKIQEVPLSRQEPLLDVDTWEQYQTVVLGREPERQE